MKDFIKELEERLIEANAIRSSEDLSFIFLVRQLKQEKKKRQGSSEIQTQSISTRTPADFSETSSKLRFSRKTRS